MRFIEYNHNGLNFKWLESDLIKMMKSVLREYALGGRIEIEFRLHNQAKNGYVDAEYMRQLHIIIFDYNIHITRIDTFHNGDPEEFARIQFYYSKNSDSNVVSMDVYDIVSKMRNLVIDKIVENESI